VGSFYLSPRLYKRLVLDLHTRSIARIKTNIYIDSFSSIHSTLTSPLNFRLTKREKEKERRKKKRGERKIMPRPTSRKEILPRLRQVIADGGIILGAGAGTSHILFIHHQYQKKKYMHLHNRTILNLILIFIPRNRPLRQIRRARRLRPDHHLQLRTVSNGGEGLIGGIDAV
jgi:hypothetical protein